MKTSTQQSAQKKMRPGFFEEAFRDAELPQSLRIFTEAFCTRFVVRGICDPMYCANIAAFETGLGDGRGNFNAVKTPSDDDIATVGDRLFFAYSTCISEASTGTTSETIATMVRNALNGASLEELLLAPVSAQQSH